LPDTNRPNPLLPIVAMGQKTEFGKSDNGLIYPDSTMHKLKKIVDSLNLKFKVCEFNKVFLAKSQAKAHFVRVDSVHAKAAKKAMDTGMPIDEFLKTFPAELEKDLLVVKFGHAESDDNQEIDFVSPTLNKKYGHEFSFSSNLGKYKKPLKGKWVYDYNEKSTYSTESVRGFYFTEEFKQSPIPPTYARMLQYSECLVDTSTQVFFDKAQRSGVNYRSNESGSVGQFMAYVSKKTHKPEYDENNTEAYYKNEKIWDSLRFHHMDSLNHWDPKFKKLLGKAVDEAVEQGGGSDEFEEYVGRYYSRKTELALKRNRRVVGGCSMDNSPRLHAVNIAMLSAETTSWEHFLRAHLDIMNDRFERVSDGSYAWAGRKTYIKELEQLDIDVTDLLLGISLRTENPGKNHYYGNISRLGRALAETEHPRELEKKMLDMLGDTTLDDYNRILVYYLFLNYNYYLPDKQVQALNQTNLKARLQLLPTYLAEKLKDLD
jgi:hypothetical protein